MDKKSKIIERKIIKEFLKFKGCKILRIIEGDNPDAIAVIKHNNKRKNIGIEQTDFHVDTEHGKPSLGRGIHQFWYHVQSSIRRRVSHIPKIQHMTGLISLARNKLPDLNDQFKARNLAAELVKLALEFPVAPDEELTINKFSVECPLLKSHVREVNLLGSGLAACIAWECSDSTTSSIGISSNEIALIIENKAKKFKNYSWNNVEERWLLITASARTVFNLSSPDPEAVDWKLHALKSACGSANVERIFFWDRTFKWYKEIWPGAPIVKQEWRASKKRGKR